MPRVELLNDTEGAEFRGGLNDMFEELYDAVQELNESFYDIEGAATAGAPYVSGNWYNGIPHARVSAQNAFGNSKIYFAPFEIRAAVTITDLAIRVTTGAAGTAQVAIYANDAALGRPTGAPLAEVAGLDTTSPAAVSGTLASPVTFQPGVYWFAVQLSSATAAISGTTADAGSMSALIGSATLANVISAAAVVSINLALTNTFGTFPTLPSGSFVESSNIRNPLPLFKVQ